MAKNVRRMTREQAAAMPAPAAPAPITGIKVTVYEKTAEGVMGTHTEFPGVTNYTVDVASLGDTLHSIQITPLRG